MSIETSNTLLGAWLIFQLIFIPAGLVLSILDLKKRYDVESEEETRRKTRRKTGENR